MILVLVMVYITIKETSLLHLLKDTLQILNKKYPFILTVIHLPILMTIKSIINLQMNGLDQWVFLSNQLIHLEMKM